MTVRPRVLILGANGMLGHRLWLELRDRVDAVAAVRSPQRAPLGLFDPASTISGIHAEDAESVRRALDAVAPTVVVNAVGIVKQAADAEDPRAAIAVNALFPHRLAEACREQRARLIHISTDCVFSGRGRLGGYSEDDVPDPIDLYGRSKLLGEVTGPGALTLRTSFIGREIAGAYGLLEWFLAKRGATVQGFRRAVFSGLTSPVLAALVSHLIVEHPTLEGLWHVGGEPIDKHALLSLVRDALALDVEIVENQDVVVDRALDSRRFCGATGWKAPGWPEMIEKLAADPVPYESLRSAGAHG